jgi:outer membrane protein
MFSKNVARAVIVVGAGVLLMGAATAQSKIAIINLQRAIVETAEIKKAQAELEAKFKPRTEELAKLQKELQDIQTELQSGKLTPQQQSDLQARGQLRQRQYQRAGEDLQAEVDRARNDILQIANQKMDDVLKKIAETGGIDVIVDVTNTVYFKPALEITDEAIKSYDAAYPVK